MCWHSAGPSLRLPHGRNGLGLEEIPGILVHPQNAQIDVAKIRYLRHRAVAVHTLQIGDALPPVKSRHGVGLPLKPPCSQNGPVLEDMFEILMFWLMSQIRLVGDTGVVRVGDPPTRVVVRGSL